MNDRYINMTYLDERLLKSVEGKCQCGHLLPFPMQILSGERTFICPKCGRNNAPPETYDD